MDQILDSFAATNETDRLNDLFLFAALVSIFISRLRYGKTLMFPFTILGTWAHESGHGIAAVLAGGEFAKLELYSDFGGAAYYRGVGRLGQAFTAAGGLIGPAIAGGIVIIFGARIQTVHWVLAIISALIILSLLFKIKNLFGRVSMSITAGLFILTALIGPDNFKIFVTQLIGVQLCMTSVGSLDYMFTKHFNMGGKQMNSDTQNISESLFLPYWFWGALIAILSFAILGLSYWEAYGLPRVLR